MPLENLENRDLYSILGVDRSDPSGAIHNAFIKLTSQYSPEYDPEGFKTIHLAYKTLMDPRARDEYDRLMACGPEISGRMRGAFSAMVQRRFKRAEQLYKEIVDDTNGASEALMLLGMAQFEQGHFLDAIHTLSALTEKFPRVQLYKINLANMLMNRWATTEEIDVRTHALKRARELYLSAIELDSSQVLPYMELAKSCNATGEFERAYEFCEKGVNANGRVDFEDFEVLLFGYHTLTLIGDVDRMHSQALRIEDVVPDIEDAKLYAVAMLVQTSAALLAKRKFQAVKNLLLCARRISPARKDSRDIDRMIDDTDIAIKVEGCWDLFNADPAIVKPVKDMAEKLFNFFLMQADVDTMDESGDIFFDELRHADQHAVRKSLRKLKNVYPAIWRLNGKFWDFVAQTVGSPSDRNQSATWLFIIISIFVLVRVIPMLIDYLAGLME